MLDVKTINIQKQYHSGQRDFSGQQLRRINLRKARLRGINLSGADLSYADLRDADLRGADLSRCYLNEANLTGADISGANLTGCYLIKAYLTKVNAQKAILKEAYLTSSFLTRANLSGANLAGTFFNNSYLTGVKFHQAVYSNATRFDRGINPEALGMIKTSSFSNNAVQKTTIGDLIGNLEKITSTITHYLGVTIATRNWEASRPDFDWLNNLSLNKQGQINYQGSLNDRATSIQIKSLQKWISSFVEKCSLFIHDLPQIIEQKHIMV